MTPGLAVDGDRQVVVRAVARDLRGSRVVALEHDHLATVDDGRPVTADRRSRARSGRSRPGGRTCRRASRHRQRRDRLVDLGAAREVRVVQAARPISNRALGPEPVNARVGPHDLTIRDPDLVVAADRDRFTARGHAGVTRVAKHQVHRRPGLTAGRGGLLNDAHAQRRKTQFGVAHELEQLGDAAAGRRSASRSRAGAAHRGRRARRRLDPTGVCRSSPGL